MKLLGDNAEKYIRTFNASVELPAEAVVVVFVFYGHFVSSDPF